MSAAYNEKQKKLVLPEFEYFFFLWVSGHRKGIGRLSLFLLSRLPITSVLLNLFFFLFLSLFYAATAPAVRTR